MEKIAYWFVRCLDGLFRFLPDRILKGAAELIAFFVRRLFRYRMSVVTDNLQQAFPELDRAQISGMLPAVYRHFVYLMVESMQSWRMDSDYIDRHISVEGIEQLDGITRDGKPVLLIGGHLGNFEWLGRYLAARVRHLYAYMKRIHNPHINRYIINKRREAGIALLFTGDGAFKKGLGCLRDGHSLALLADQDAGEQGIYVRFMNRPAATAAGPALFHILTGLPVFLCTAIRRDFGKFHILIARLPERAACRPRDQHIFNITQQYTEMLEQLVRRFPEQYFWTHRRWKNQPDPEELAAYHRHLRVYQEKCA